MTFLHSGTRVMMTIIFGYTTIRDISCMAERDRKTGLWPRIPVSRALSETSEMCYIALLRIGVTLTHF